MRPFICIGDKTDHGGTVIEADMTFEIYGKPVALSGHKVVCRKCSGTFPIEKAAEDMTSMGQQVARHGDKTACGAMLIASSRWPRGPRNPAAVKPRRPAHPPRPAQLRMPNPSRAS